MNCYKCTRLVKNRLSIYLFLLAGASFSCTAHADEWIQPGEETLRLDLGFFLTSFDTSLRVDNRDIDIGTGIDLENDLGLDDSETIVWTAATWRFARRHRLGITYFQLGRDATVTANKDLKVDNEIIPVGATVTTKFDMDVVPIAYTYSFIKTPKHELSGSFGLHWNSINFEIQGAAFIQNAGADGKASAKAAAPMPLFGVRYDYYVTKRWHAGVHAQYFDISISEDTFSFAGSIANVRVSTEYWLYNNFGIGAAINYFSLDVDVDDSEWKGTFDYEYFGPQIYLVARF